MTTLDDDMKARLDVAFNEASLCGIEVAPAERVVAVTLDVLTLPEAGPAPEDSRVQVLLSPVGRIAASQRVGRWHDQEAEVVPFEIDALLDVVHRFEGQPIYGWAFFDQQDEALPRWGHRLSLDWRSGTDGDACSLCLFQEGIDRHLDILIWFDRLEIRDPSGRVLPLDEFAAGGERWWDALYSGDPRTERSGIVPLKDGP